MSIHIEATIAAWLLADPAVTAIAGTRVGGRTPSSTSEPWARVMLLDGRSDPTSRAEHLEHSNVQIDCYAGSDPDGQIDAADLAAVVRSRLHVMGQGTHDDVVVTGVTGIARRRIPDPNFAPARERYIVTCTVHSHPT